MILSNILVGNWTRIFLVIITMQAVPALMSVVVAVTIARPALHWTQCGSPGSVRMTAQHGTEYWSGVSCQVHGVQSSGQVYLFAGTGCIE